MSMSLNSDVDINKEVKESAFLSTYCLRGSQGVLLSNIGGVMILVVNRLLISLFLRQFSR